MNRWLACSLAGTIAAFAAVSLATAGCGGTVNNGSDSGPDAGGHPDHSSPVDSSTGKDVRNPKDTATDTFTSFDAGGDAPSDVFMIPTEGGPTIPTGATQLMNTADAGLQGLSLSTGLQGITDDGYVIAVGTKGTMLPVYAIPLAGGATITIIPDLGAAGYGPSVIHDTVFMWTAGTAVTATGNVVGSLKYWTKASGLQSPTGNSTVGLVSATPDGTKVAYTTGVSADGSTGDLVVSNADGTGKMTLVSGMVTNASATTTFFSPEINFTNDTYFVADHEAVGDAGFTPSVVSCWTTATWAKTDLVTGAATTTGFSTPVLTSGTAWSTSTTGTGIGAMIVAATSAGALQAFTLPSATAVPIDTGVTSLTMKPDGTGVLYGTGSVGPYKLATLPTPGTATSILASGFGGFITGYSGFPAFSPDGNWTLYYKVAGTNPGEFDLNVVHNIAAATGTSLLSAPTGAVFNDAFTADSAYALYYTNFKLIGTSAAVGELSGYPVAGSKAISVSTNSVWNSYGVTGAKVAYNDNYTPASTSTTSFAGYADIYVADLSVSPLVPASIVKTADESFFLSADKLKLVFSMSVGNTSTDGIWVVTP